MAGEPSGIRCQLFGAAASAMLRFHCLHESCAFLQEANKQVLNISASEARKVSVETEECCFGFM